MLCMIPLPPGEGTDEYAHSSAVFLFSPCILFVTHCLWEQEKVTLFLSAHSSAFFAHVDCPLLIDGTVHECDS